MEEDIWKEDIWDPSQEEMETPAIAEEEAIIPEDQAFDEGEDEQWFSDLMTEYDEDDEITREMKSDPYLASWLPTEPVKAKPVTSNAKYAYNYLNQKGLPSHVSAGIVGNLMKESGVNPASRDGDSRGGIGGIAQWDPSRSRGLMQYSQSTGRSPKELETQLDFVLHEAQQRGDLNKVMSAKTPEEAAVIFGRNYERPNEKYADWASRQAYARGLETRVWGGEGQDEELTNIPDSDYLYGVSDAGVLAYMEDEGMDTSEFDDTSNTNGIGAAVGAVSQGIDTYNKVSGIANNFKQRALRGAIQAVDVANEVAGYQRNAATMRKYRQQRNRKIYSAPSSNLNQPLIFS